VPLASLELHLLLEELVFVGVLATKSGLLLVRLESLLVVLLVRKEASYWLLWVEMRCRSGCCHLAAFQATQLLSSLRLTRIGFVGRPLFGPALIFDIFISPVLGLAIIGDPVVEI